MSIKAHIQSLKESIFLKEEKKRKEFLVAKGLGKIIFGENVTEPNKEFPEKELDEGVWTGRCFKYEVPDISEAEYQELITLQKKLENFSNTSKSYSSVGVIFRVIGWFLLVVAVLAGLILISTDNGFAFGLTVGFSMAVSSLFFFGFGEVIILLNEIKIKLDSFNLD
jgi:hypothetical protein